MPISGIVICCQINEIENVVNRLQVFSQLEISRKLEDGHIVAIIEAESVDGEVTVVKNIMNVPGVIDVRLAYHNFEDVEVSPN